MALVLRTGGTTVDVGGTNVSITSHHNLLHIIYILVFLRVAQWWLRDGRQRIALWGERTRQAVYWHALPVAVWFLLKSEGVRELT